MTSRRWMVGFDIRCLIQDLKCMQCDKANGSMSELLSLYCLYVILRLLLEKKTTQIHTTGKGGSLFAKQVVYIIKSLKCAKFCQNTVSLLSGCIVECHSLEEFNGTTNLLMHTHESSEHKMSVNKISSQISADKYSEKEFLKFIVSSQKKKVESTEVYLQGNTNKQQNRMFHFSYSLM